MFMQDELRKESLPRVLPFALFMAFIGIEEAIRYAGKKGFFVLGDHNLLYLYPLKVVSVLLVLLYFWKRYDEIDIKHLLSLPKTAVSIVTGVVVFILWINMDWTFGGGGGPAGYNASLL